MNPKTVVLTILLAAPPAGLHAQTPALKVADSLFQARMWPQAETAYRGIVEKDSTSYMAWYRLGRIQLEVKRDAGNAKRFFEASLRHGFKPAFFPQFAIAKAEALAGHTPEAFDRLEQLASNSGFSQVGAISEDSILMKLAGSPRYDALLARVRRNAEPCEFLPQARQLDFWIGNWEVYASNGNRIGSNRVERTLRGCALVENWTDGFGREGKSFNFFDPGRSTWRQVWVADNGSVSDYTTGELTGNMMRFGARTVNANGDTALQRLTFTRVHTDTVRQEFEQSTDRGNSWQPTFVGIYIRRKQAAAGK